MDSNKNTYTCLIVDDEPLARELIMSYCEKLPFLKVAATCSSAIEAMQWLKEHEADILFLDIQMPNLTGIEMLKSVKIQPKVILITAYSEFALEGFNLDVSDYLLKPVTFERFNQAVAKTTERLDLERKIKSKADTGNEKDSIVIKSSHRMIKVSVKDIIYIEGLHKYIRIVTEDKKYTTLYSIAAMEADLPDNFYRCHRSFIVNLEKVDLLDGNELHCGTYRVPVSKNNKAVLIEKLGKKIGG